MHMNRRIGILAALAFCIAIGALLVQRGEVAPATPATVTPVAAPSTDLPPEPRTAIVNDNAQSQPDGGEPTIPEADRFVRLPDGSRTRVLNGAYGAPPMLWPRGRPYSPIVKTVRDARNFEWFVHADGTMSITQMAFRTDLGRTEAVTNVFCPTDRVEMESAGDARGDAAPGEGAPDGRR